MKISGLNYLYKYELNIGPFSLQPHLCCLPAGCLPRVSSCSGESWGIPPWRGFWFWQSSLSALSLSPGVNLTSLQKSLSKTKKVRFCQFFLAHTVDSGIIGLPEFLPLNPVVNESGNIKRCGNKMHLIAANMIFSQYLQLKLSLLWRTIISGQHPLF